MAESPSGGYLKDSDFPWKGQPEEVACNLALGNLANNLPARVTVDGRIHAETYLTVCGVIAGFAAQRSLFARVAESNDDAILGQIHVATTKNGEKLFFGDPLNFMLIGTPDVAANERLWPLAAGGAVAAGLDAAHIPKLGDMFGHVSSTIGGEEEGMPSVPRKNFPHVAPKELLRLFWPLAAMCFAGQLPGVTSQFGAAAPRFWPAITGYVANKVIRDVSGVVDPRTSLIILMETAIYASKLDPVIVNSQPPEAGTA